MKKIVLIIAGALMFSYHVFSQNMQNMVQDTYVSQPDFDLMDNSLSRVNNQYQSGVAAVKNAYSAIVNIELINKFNIAILKTYKDNVEVYVNRNDVKNADYSMPANVNGVCNTINRYLQVQSIKNEINLLNKIWSEFNRLKEKNPENFASSDRYKELQQVLNSLENCPVNEIGSLAWKHGIY